MYWIFCLYHACYVFYKLKYIVLNLPLAGSGCWRHRWWRCCSLALTIFTFCVTFWSIGIKIFVTLRETPSNIILWCLMYQHCFKEWCVANNLFWLTKRVSWLQMVMNSLAPGKFEWNFRHVIFKQILVIDDWGISCEIALTWKPRDLTDDKSTLVQVMAWCRQATSHYLSHCWPNSMSPYGVTRPQWVNSFWSNDSIWHYGPLINIFSSNGLLSDGTKPLPKPMLTCHQ